MYKRKLGTKVSPLSKDVIGHLAHRLRDELDIRKPFINVCKLLDILAELGVAEYSVVEDDELGEEEALTYPDEGLILIKESIYDRAAAGDGHCRFTIAHEFAHLFLHRNQKTENSYARGKISPPTHKIFCDSEWQADVFASYLLMDSRFISESDEARDLTSKFGVSIFAAQMRLKSFRYN